METPKLNNQPKVDLEKTAQENDESLNDQGQESGKRENILLEIDGQKIEAVKYYFEYPERIQKETGILGYDRVKILRENLKVSVESIIHKLSDGEYPGKCLTHVMGGHAHKEDKPEMFEDFAKDKFFLQKIYDVDTIKRKNERNTPVGNLFNYSTTPSDNDHRQDKRSTFSLYKKNSDGSREKVAENQYIGNIINYKNELASGDYFAATTESGFNTIASGLWDSHDSTKENSFCVGFPLYGTDDFYNEYLEESLKEYSLSINERKRDGLGEPSVDNFSSLALLWFLSKNKANISLEGVSDVEKKGSAGQKFSDLMNTFIKENPSTHAISSINFNEARAAFFPDEKGQYLYGNRAEYQIPVFIGHDKIPQLSWGHAKYAHYFNDKSFNFFKFKHADHLPSKEEINSSES